MKVATKKVIAVLAIVALMLTMFLLSFVFLASSTGTSAPPWLPVVAMSELPSDGTPILKTVYAAQFDAWTRLPDKPICAVFVRRAETSSGVPVLPSWHHDSLRIPLRFDNIDQQYISLCRNVAFDMEGIEIRANKTMSMGATLTQLPVQVADGVVWSTLEGVNY